MWCSSFLVSETSTKSKIILGHGDDLDHGQVMAMLGRQSEVTEGETDVEGGIGGRAGGDPRRYSDLTRAEGEEEEDI